MSNVVGGDGGSTAFEHILFPRATIHEPAGQLAQFLADLTWEAVPGDVLHQAKLILLDTLGCIAAGVDTPLGRDIVAAYDSGNVADGCSVAGTSLRLAPSMAAKVNAWLADVLDYEDVAVGHPSATVVPAALAMAEHCKATPKQFLAGIVAGYEAGIRLHDATRATPEAYRRLAVYHGWHGVAAGAAAMVVSGGSEERFRSALGHAAANTCLPLWYVQYGRPAHALKANYGQMALGGVDAALCARQGIVGPFAMLSDPERGFAQMIGSDQFDASRLSAQLAEVWRLRESSLKAYPSCAFLHTTIDAVSQLVGIHSIDHADVERVSIRTFSRIPEWFSDPAPSSPIDAQLSVQFVTAMALLSIETGRHWYAPSTMADPRVSALMQKMDIDVDPDAEQAFWSNDKHISSVAIAMKSGQCVDASVEWPPGHWRRPLSDPEVASKFLLNVHGTALEPRAAQIIEVTTKLDEHASMDALLDLLRVLPRKERS